MIERAHKLAFDFTAAFAEENVATAAASLRVPTLLFSGGLSPYVTQRIVQRLGGSSTVPKSGICRPPAICSR